MLVKPGLGNVGRKLEVFEQLGFGGVQNIHFDIFAEVSAINHQFEATPGGFQFLQLGRMQNFIHLGADLAIQFDHHLVNQCLVDRLAFFFAFQQVGNKRCNAFAGDIIAFISWRHATVGHDLVEQGAFHYRFRGSGLLRSSIRHTTSLQYVIDIWCCVPREGGSNDYSPSVASSSSDKRVSRASSLSSNSCSLERNEGTLPRGPFKATSASRNSISFFSSGT